MCAINGFNFKNESLVKKMNEVTSHRGPDATDFWCNEQVSLGHNRLSIIDLSDNAKQPMWDESEEVGIVFNGEIYNYKELKKDLVDKYNFKSKSDTEVIIYAYKEYGKECFKKLNGIFALAIYDKRTEEIILARDHIGVKPLYYYNQNNLFIFSSEIKGILKHSVTPEVNKDAFNFYFHLLYTPEPLTMFKDISKLPAASYLVYKNGQAQTTKYWQVTDFSNLKTKSEATKKIRNLFDESVNTQLVSDRPLGVFLSGGIDSTAILGSMKKHHSGKVKTFSVGFRDSTDEEKFNSDFLLARKTADHYQTDHTEIKIGGVDMLEILPKIARQMDEPNANPTAGAIYLLSKTAKQQVAVILGGDGADELFGGYPRYFYSRELSFLSQLPLARYLASLLLKIRGRLGAVAKFKLGPSPALITSFLGQYDGLLKKVLNPGLISSKKITDDFEYKFFPNSTKDFEKHFMNVDRQSWLVDESLLRSDKMTMAHGLEERVPILDYRLVELANKIPTKWKFKVFGQTAKSFQGKSIWKKAVMDYLPEHILWQPKRGWFTPMAKWLRQEPIKSFVEEIISEDSLPPEYFNYQEVQKVWQNHLSGKVYNLNIIWAIVMWVLWYNEFVKK